MRRWWGVCCSSVSRSWEPIWSQLIRRQVGHESSWRSVRCWTIHPEISSRVRVVFHCGIGCGLPAARISCASMIGSGISFVASTDREPRCVPLTCHPFPSRRSVVDSFAGAVFAMRQAELAGAVGIRLTGADSLRLMNEMVQTIQGEPHELASYLPRYVDFRCSEDGTMWMHPFDVDAGGLSGGPLWLRIAPDGATQEVRLPDRFDAFRFSSSRIWGVNRDELDIPSVASISLRTR